MSTRFCAILAFEATSLGKDIPSGTVSFKQILKIVGSEGFVSEYPDRLEIAGKSFPVVGDSVEHAHWEEVLLIIQGT